MLTPEQMQNRLDQALNRIALLEKKLDTMRFNINANLNGHTDILHTLAVHTDCNAPIRFLHVDVAAE
ncbi:MAG: hypothetical protein ABSD57_12785 [Verrucomicrobiota bacterium]